MGCRESKSKDTTQSVIVVKPGGDEKKNLEDRLDLSVSMTSFKSGVARELPNSVLDEEDSDIFIYNSDLGESLDLRRGVGAELFPGTHSATSNTSADSGIYDELDAEYSYIITEKSDPDVVANIESSFVEPEDLDLTLIGSACKRLMSGSQKVRYEEEEVMNMLKQEGLISSKLERSSKGLAFEVVELNQRAPSAVGNRPGTSALPPLRQKSILDAHRRKYERDLTSAKLEERLEKAAERRKQLEEEKVKKAVEAANKDRIHDPLQESMSSLSNKMESKETAAKEARAQHLKQLRDRLKEKHSKAAQIRLRKQWQTQENSPPVPVPMAMESRGDANEEKPEADDFFQ